MSNQQTFSENSVYNSIFFYDLETTALNTKEASILECFVRNWTNTIQFHWYVYPSNSLPITNSHIHQITEQVLIEKNAMNTTDFLTDLRNRLEEERRKIENNVIYFIAHNNNRYDKLVLEEEFKRARMNIPEEWIFRDSLVHFRRMYPNLGYGKYKLAELFKLFENDCKTELEECLQGEQIIFHGAKIDTHIMAVLYKRKIAGNFREVSNFYSFLKLHI
jgi:DNA polymerase III epsilon subunit-like protein